MKAVAEAVGALSQADIARLEQEGRLTLTLADGPATIERESVEIVSEDIPGWTVANEGTLTVALDLELDDDLRREGLAREIVKRIQAYRKDSGFEITDHIQVTMTHQGELAEAVVAFGDYIRGQVLADGFTLVEALAEGEEMDFDGRQVRIKIEKV